MRKLLTKSFPAVSNRNLTQAQTIDDKIKSQIEKLTSENDQIWTSPDHNRREYVHSFFQYPAMMVPVVQKRIIDIIVQHKPETKKIIDPFMGSATSLVACMQNGLDCYGQDINPLAVLIAKTRTGPYYVNKVKNSFETIKELVETDDSKFVESKFKGWDKWFKNSVAVELSKIVRAIRSENRISIRRFFWINLAETIRLTSNDRTSTFKLHARPLDEIEKRNLSPISEFKKQVQRSIEDLELYRDLLKNSGQISNDVYKAEINIKLQDSSKKISPPKDQFFDLLITSPPYGDNKTTVTYGQHSYLPLQWIDLEDIDRNVDSNCLNSTLEIDTRSLGGKVKKINDSELKLLFSHSSTFKITYNKLKSKFPDKVDKVVVFLRDLYNVLKNIFSVMKTDSYQIWTIGNRTVGGIEIPNNIILKEFISSLNGILVAQIEREIINKRMARWNNSSTLMNTEDILIFRKIGK